MRVVSFNLLHGLTPGSPTVSADAVADAVRQLDPDVLCLQEVDRDQPRSGGLDLAALCADAMGAVAWRFAPALTGLPGAMLPATGAGRDARPDARPGAGPDAPTGPAYGVALASRLPVRSWRTRVLPPPRMPMPMPGLVPVARAGRIRLAAPRVIRDASRVLLAAELDGLSVCCAHLTFVQGPNVGQLRAATGLLAGMPGPRLLLGDLNMAAPLPALLSRWHPLVRGRTFPAWRPRLQIDHVLADRPLPVTAARVLRLGISDHRAVVVDL